MLVNFSNKLRQRTIEFCDDELLYHIEDSGCANEYHDEIMAEIEILSLLGEKDMALKYAELYLEYSQDDFYVEEKLSENKKRQVRNLIKRIKE